MTGTTARKAQQVQSGAIDLASTLEVLGIDDIGPSLTSAEKQATIADLLTMRSGVYHEAEFVSELASLEE